MRESKYLKRQCTLKNAVNTAIQSIKEEKNMKAITHKMHRRKTEREQ